MNFVEYSRSLLTVPGGYNDVRPHHLVLAAGLFQLATSSTIYRKVSEKILSVMSGLTESFIPLVQLGLVPDFIIRFGIRLQLRDHLNILRGETVESEMKDKMKIEKLQDQNREIERVFKVKEKQLERAREKEEREKEGKKDRLVWL